MYENENDANGIQEVLKVLHRFVPFADVDDAYLFEEQGNVGDQLSVERVVN